MVYQGVISITTKPPQTMNDGHDDKNDDDDDDANNNKGIEREQQTNQSLPASGSSEGVVTVIDTYHRPNGAHFGPIDGRKQPPLHISTSNIDGRRQHWLAPSGKRVILSTITNRSAHSQSGAAVDGGSACYSSSSSGVGDGDSGVNKGQTRWDLRLKDKVGKVCVKNSRFSSSSSKGLVRVHRNDNVGNSESSKVLVSNPESSSIRICFGVSDWKEASVINSPSLKSTRVDPRTVCHGVKSGSDASCAATHTPGNHSRSNFLEERIRAMYNQRRLNIPSSARSHSNRPRSGNSGRPHSSRARTSSSFPCLQDVGGDGGHHSMELGPIAKFRLVARMAIVLIRLMKAIINNSNDLTTRSAAELQWLTVYGRDTQAAMAFNKNIYSRDRSETSRVVDALNRVGAIDEEMLVEAREYFLVMTHIPEWAMSILELEPECRTELHCRRLHALLRGLKSFDKFTDEIQMSLCRAFRLEIVTEGRILLKHGHIGVYFYFIYSGSVFVNAHDKARDGTSFMRTITVLTRGQSFGELALLQDIKRTATVSVREKCELLVVDKEVFARVCPKIFEKELEDKRNVLSGMSLFPSKWWGPEAMRALSMEAQIQEFKINKVIVPDSSLEDWIYTCIEGKCQVIHCLSLQTKTSDNTEKTRKTSDIVLSEEIIDLLSSATTTVAKTNEQEVDADIKEKLLSSLGLDYVATGKRRHAYVKDDVEKERLRAIQGLDEATTLTALMRKREETKKGLVYLNVGVIEPGDVFDLHSLVRDERDPPSQTSCLMLVSGGAKILKVRKAAFYEHASDQALEHTRTLASRQRFLSDESLIESYKEKKKWEKYKSEVVHSVLNIRRHSRCGDHLRGTPCSSRAQTPRPKSQRFTRSARTSQSIMSATSRCSSHNEESHTDLVLNVIQKENQAPSEISGRLISQNESLNRTNEESLNKTKGDISNRTKENASRTQDESLNIIQKDSLNKRELDTSDKSVNILNNSTLQLESETQARMKEEEEEDMTQRPASLVPSFDTKAVIIRRHAVRVATPRGRVLTRSISSRPHTSVHPRFSNR